MTKWITREYLRNHPDHIFVFGDNLERRGKGGAAKLRNEPNTYGFITKKSPNNKATSFYRPEEYASVFADEFAQLLRYIQSSPSKVFLITQLGSGLANRYNIYERVIEERLRQLNNYPNVELLF